jgi:dihydrofolate synthase/folylpolyglutamate synthase
LAVYGALEDKDVESVTVAMAAQVDQWFPAALDVPRGLGCRDLTARMNLPENAMGPGCAGSVEAALQSALSAARSTDLVLIFGSFFTVAAARAQLL